MVEIDKEKTHRVYKEIIEILNEEVITNKSILPFIQYLEKKHFENMALNDQTEINDLREFIRGVNRFSDEFTFSEINENGIKNKLYDLYNILNIASNPNL